ncbi:MAG: hypothetical protein E7330_06015 [Clostridiales bacterium]|nr:hypothetical protein [Clostridiales bacterium]
MCTPKLFADISDDVFEAICITPQFRAFDKGYAKLQEEAAKAGKSIDAPEFSSLYNEMIKLYMAVYELADSIAENN